MIPEERAANVIGRVDESTTTEDLQQMIADAVRDAVKDDREKAGRSYHPKPGELMRITCLACRGENPAGCEECGGRGWMMAKHGGEAVPAIRRTGRKIPTPEEVLERHSIAPDAPVLAALTEIEALAREYCASLFDDLAEQMTAGRMFGKLDDDEYSRRVVGSALSGYAHHVRIYQRASSGREKEAAVLSELFSLPYRTPLDVLRLLVLDFEGHREFEHRLAQDLAVEISEWMREDDVLEHLAEAVGARMIQIFYRGIERRLDDLKEAGVPVDEEAVRKSSG